MITLDRNLEMVLEFMERNVELEKLPQVADAVASLAPMLWSRRNAFGENRLVQFRPECNREQLSTATQLAPEREYECGGSAEVADSHKQTSPHVHI